MFEILNKQQWYQVELNNDNCIYLAAFVCKSVESNNDIICQEIQFENRLPLLV